MRQTCDVSIGAAPYSDVIVAIDDALGAGTPPYSELGATREL